MSRFLRARWAIVAAVVVLAGVVVALEWPRSSESLAESEISVSRSSCGEGWNAKPGPQTLQVRNAGAVTAEVELIDPDTGMVYGEIDGLGAGTIRALPVDLGNGEYAFRCLPEGDAPFVGPKARVSGGSDRRGPAVVPVTNADLLGPVKAYHEYVQNGLGALSEQTAALKAALLSGNRTASQAAWLTAHLTYERLGAAYDAFGDADAAINETGFHGLEAGLWRGDDPVKLAGVAEQLETDVHGLRESFASAQIDQNDLGLRAHEIMENSLQFELTGKTDAGSGTNLATVLANVDGTSAVLEVLRPVLTPRFPGLSTVDKWMNRTRTAVSAARRPDGSWTPLAGLDPALRQKINGSVAELTEQLAPIAAIAEPRRVS
ncbi:iron uptake system component EfeO [Amycolatopsis xylanica]|uniref:Iron uptake system component EfeO n=1 Tax=Amycolatopsis xylanica TaxID=589385 RepID=A0A1H2TRR6_9PSEU|nr:EfeM/EfeO family lipoprotein [Amycolatopsis xylanica]SDW46457.1 iron uptake system component EfeO [Amycolatopsis xylanica]